MSYRSLISARHLADKLVALRYIDGTSASSPPPPASSSSSSSLGGAGSLRVCDATVASADPESSFLDAHIPGAVFFDLNECADRRSGLTRTVPSPALFEDYVNSLGIGGSCVRTRDVCIICSLSFVVQDSAIS